MLKSGESLGQFSRVNVFRRVKSFQSSRLQALYKVFCVAIHNPWEKKTADKEDDADDNEDADDHDADDDADDHDGDACRCCREFSAEL